MKKLYFFLGFLSICSSVQLSAQPYGNEWIDYGQNYFKFQVTESGIYRISSFALTNSGVPISSIDPRQLQIFGKGEELHIYVEGESDGNFDTGDFIEFYAEGNDGWLDERLYGNSNSHPNPYYSLINDTATYYLTWNNSTSNRRMTIENDVNFAAYSPSPYFYAVEKQNFNSNYFDGKTNFGGATDAEYTPSEGWFDAPITLGGSKTKSITTRNRYSSGPSSTIQWAVVGASDHATTVPDHHLNVQFASTIFDSTYEGYSLLKKTFSISTVNLDNNATSFTFSSINDLGSPVDRSTISYISIKYPHTYDMDARSTFDMVLPDQLGSTKSRVDISNFNASSTVRLYDLDNHKRVVVLASGPNYQALVPNSGGEKQCHLTSDAQVKLITQLNPINGTGSFTDLSTIIEDSAFILITHRSFSLEADMYANYRRMTGFSVVRIFIDELYDQFGYGVNTHPLSMRGFADYALDNWPSPPQNLFLIGKSIKAKLYRKSSAQYAKNLVPSFGNPASDILITAGLNGTILEPAIATGRLSASNSDQVGWYLDKMVEYESNANAEWMKTILHFAGGSSKQESDRFSSYLEGYENILEDTLFGGFVHTFKKSTTAPIQITLSDSIASLINSGVSIMDFFGHASASGGFDQNIDEPSSYNNKGKYPLLVANSCFAGDIHGTSGFSTSEQFILIKDRGMIGFIASTDLGFESILNAYSNELFRNIGQTNYGKGIGESMKRTIIAIQGNGKNTSIRSTCFEMTLHGDPALIVNSHDKPDYSISEPNVFFTPNEVTTELDSFDLNVVITNLGRALDRDIAVTLTRIYPNAQARDTTYERIIEGVRYKDTIRFRMPVDPINGPGINTFEINVDAFSLIDELREDNNFVSISSFIRSGNIVPILPYTYAIVPRQGIELQASTGYPFEPAQNYVFELDTTDEYNSPFKQSRVINQSGGIVKWQPDVLKNMPNDQVYFWRTSKEASKPEDFNWKESSFKYIPSKTGWSQDHFYQFKNDDYTFINHNRSTRKFDFVTSLRKLTCVTASTTSLALLSNVNYKIDSDRIEWGGCSLGAAIHIAVLDSLTFEPWGTPFLGQNAANDFGQLNKNGNCGKNRVQNFFIFNANNAGHLAGLKDMLTNKVPDGHYVLAWTWVRNDFSKWDAIDPTMRQVFSNLGADSISGITNDTIPYIFFVKKGNPNSSVEVLGDKVDELITLKTDLQNNSTFGSIASELIGPASRWDSLNWDYYSIETPSLDSISLTVHGINSNGETTLIPTIPSTNKKLSITPQVNANQFPYLKLEAFIADDSLQSAAQLDLWELTYEGVPEVAINPDIHFSFHNDTLQEGELLDFSVAVENISEYDTDSLLISYYILDKDRNKHIIPYPRQKKLLADSVLITSVEFPTNGLVGLNTFVIEVNPNNDQPEQYAFNNFGQIPFYVLKDNSNPVLDVAFDGVHILDGDIVSAKPEIVIQLSDENKYLALNDTADFRVWITDPNRIERRVHFAPSGGQTNMQFIPASLPKNTARIIYNPELNVDGIYQLRVQASDKSKNESGSIDYQISFEVINRSTITNLLNYPNPFTTSTRFVFVLTGSVIPDAMQIQIMTITGKLVKTIDIDDIGQIRIGRNVTDFTWDGTDDYGDRLANGVYLYRVKTRINGEKIEQRKTSADKYFKKGFGKMYLMK